MGLLTDAEREQLEAIAKRLADSNDVEAAWTLRGMIDCLNGDSAEDDVGEYASNYRAGFLALERGEV